MPTASTPWRSRTGLLELRGLAAGDYDLWLKQTGERIRVRVVDGPIVDGYVLGQLRDLELPALKPVQIAVHRRRRDDLVTVQLRDVSPFARVHVFATRYRPAFSAFADLGKVRDAESGRRLSGACRIGLPDRPEHRRRVPLRARPQDAEEVSRATCSNGRQLLLNPWAVRSTETGEQLAEGGRGVRQRAGSAAGTPAPAPAVESPCRSRSASATGGLRRPRLPGRCLGRAREPRARQGRRGQDRPQGSRPARDDPRRGRRSAEHDGPFDVALPEQPAKFLDLRLRPASTRRATSPSRSRSRLPAGKAFVLADAAASRFEAYDSLAKVYGLYATLSQDPKLAEFAFVLNWPKLSRRRSGRTTRSTPATS